MCRFSLTCKIVHSFWQIVVSMLVVFSPIIVVDTKIMLNYNLKGPLKYHENWEHKPIAII